VRSQILARFEREIQEKVRVEEVQDALRRLTEQFNMKLEQQQERSNQSIALRNEESLAKLSNTFDLIQGQIKDM